jgi:hypothetical protein
MPAHEWEAIDTKRELAFRHLIHLRRWRNLNAFPLFRLPTELILGIFGLAVKLYGLRFWLILTAICHPLREMLIHSPLPWRVIDTDSVPLANLFLERSKFDPHVLFTKSWDPSITPSRVSFWEQLEGRTFNNLRFLIFRGQKAGFERDIAGLLRRRPNLTGLEIEARYRSSWHLEWPPDNQLPHLTMLRLRRVRIYWTAPIFRNLTKLLLDYTGIRTPDEYKSIQTFLFVLGNCPDLESLQLISAGPDPESDDQDDCKVVRLPKLQDLVLHFSDPIVAACILSYIWFPESTEVEVQTYCYEGLCTAISEVLPPRDAEVRQHLRKTTTVSIDLGSSYKLTTDNLRLILLNGGGEALHRSNLEASPEFVSKVVEIIGSDTVTAVHVRFGLPFDIPRGVWEGLLHGFRRLEVISYSTVFGPSVYPMDPFSTVFSESFQGELVCPQLWDLRIPWSLTQASSASSLKRTLAQRDACGRRLKRLSLTQEVDDAVAVLGPFRDFVDEVSGARVLDVWRSTSVSRFLPRNNIVEN